MPLEAVRPRLPHPCIGGLAPFSRTGQPTANGGPITARFRPAHMSDGIVRRTGLGRRPPLLPGFVIALPRRDDLHRPLHPRRHLLSGARLMKPLERILATAKQTPKRVVLAEGEDPRIVEAAIMAEREGIAEITLVGNRKVIERALADAGASERAFRIEDPASSRLAPKASP